MASPIAVVVHFATLFLEYCASPFDACDLRDALKEARGRMADIHVGLFVANAEPEPCLHRGALLSQPSKCIRLEPKRSRLTERRGKTCRIQQRNVRGGETAETQSTDQVPLCRKARDSCPRSAHDIVGDEPGEPRVTDVVRVPSRGPPMRHEDQGHRRDASALHQRREDRKRMNSVSVVLTVKKYAQRVVRLWPLDEPCGTHVLALRALDGHFLFDHGSNLPRCCPEILRGRFTSWARQQIAAGAATRCGAGCRQRPVCKYAEAQPSATPDHQPNRPLPGIVPVVPQLRTSGPNAMRQTQEGLSTT